MDQGDICEIEILNEGKGDMFLEKDIIVLTISSFLFRVLTIFHIGEDKATKDYFLKKSSNLSLMEVFAEVGNLCSGAMNQELSQHFPHLGMSTPYTLSSQCLSYLSELNPGHMSRHAITINGSARLQATICMCGYAPIDFTVDKTATLDTSGELELF